MTDLEKKAEIENLTIVLEEKMRYYNDCVKKDEVFEVRKAIRVQIREIQRQIEELQGSNGQRS